MLVSGLLAEFGVEAGEVVALVGGEGEVAVEEDTVGLAVADLEDLVVAGQEEECLRGDQRVLRTHHITAGA
jgi:hypothetical protein